MIVKDVESFIAALTESMEKNKMKENDEVKGYMSFTKEELAELKNKEYNEIYNEPNEVNVSNISAPEHEKHDFKDIKFNQVLNKECIVSTDWLEADEEELPVIATEVIKKCECGGEFEYTPGSTQTLEYPPHYTHTCNKCGKTERFLTKYPYVKYKRVKFGEIHD